TNADDAATLAKISGAAARLSILGRVQRKVRFGMVGGGEGAFIGAVHRAAARVDNHLELVCGTFSSVAERGQRTAESLGLDPARSYPDYETMFATEAALPPEQRMEFVAI